WRLVLRSASGAAAAMEAVIVDVIDRLRSESASLVSTIVSSQDRQLLHSLKRHGFIEGAERWPLYIPTMEGPGACQDGFAQMSYLDTDLGIIP
ncbi:MAG: hypothetical protein LC656_01530, partial [Sphingomonadales bacterium]|nr:hypothetical protein [Sphingomonadales bacterium]